MLLLLTINAHTLEAKKILSIVVALKKRWIIPHVYDVTWLIFETLCPPTFNGYNKFSVPWWSLLLSKPGLASLEVPQSPSLSVPLPEKIVWYRTQWRTQEFSMLVYLLRGWKKVKAGLFKGGDTLPHDFRRVLFTCQKVADG